LRQLLDCVLVAGVAKVPADGIKSLRPTLDSDVQRSLDESAVE
jgi:hypothetical protein